MPEHRPAQQRAGIEERMRRICLLIDALQEVERTVQRVKDLAER